MMTCLTSAFNVEDVDIEEAIAEVAAVVGERPQLVHTRAGQPWVGLTTNCAVHIAHIDWNRAEKWRSCGLLTGGSSSIGRPSAFHLGKPPSRTATSGS